MTVKVYVEHGVEYRHEELDEGMVEIDVYQRHHTLVPDDGRQRVNELRHVLNAAGIKSKHFVTGRRLTAPLGSGPGGRVRFGDDMMHAIWRTAVSEKDVVRAQAAIAAHNEAVRKWLHEGAAMPEACRQ